MDRDTALRLAIEAKLVSEWGKEYPSRWQSGHDLAPYVERFAELVLANAAKQAQVSDAFAKALGQVDAHLANVDARIKTVKDAVLAEREACAHRASIALLGADRGLANRVDHAIRSRT